MNILITGISGFVGSNFTRYLLNAYPDANIVGVIKNKPDVRTSILFDNEILPRITVAFGDILDADFIDAIVTRYEIDTIVHLASLSIVRSCNENPLYALYTNVVGSAVIQEVARRHKHVKHVINFTSDKSYGQAETLPYFEDKTSLKGIHPYECTKTLSDMWSQMYQINYDLPVSIVRSANIFGPGDSNFSRLIPQVCTSIAKDKNPWLWSGVANYVREFVYIDDVSQFLINLIDKGRDNPDLIKHAYNLGSGNVFKIKDLVEKFVSITGKELVVEIKEKETDFKEIPEQYLSLDKTKEKLGWEAFYVKEQFDYALTVTYNYYANIVREKE